MGPLGTKEPDGHMNVMDTNKGMEMWARMNRMFVSGITGVLP